MSSKKVDTPTNAPLGSDLGSRLIEFRKAKGWTTKLLADVTGIPRPTLSEVQRGKYDLSGEKLAALVRNTDIDATWLLTGEGSMIRSPPVAVMEPPGDPAIVNLLRSAEEVLTSENDMLSDALAKNIRSFAHALRKERKLDEVVAELDQMKDRMAILEKAFLDREPFITEPGESSDEEAV